MKKIVDTKKQTSKKKHDLFGTIGIETSIPALSDEQLTTVVGGAGPKIPKNAAD